MRVDPASTTITLSVRPKDIPDTIVKYWPLAIRPANIGFNSKDAPMITIRTAARLRTPVSKLGVGAGAGSSVISGLTELDLTTVGVVGLTGTTSEETTALIGKASGEVKLGADSAEYAGSVKIEKQNKHNNNDFFI